MRILIVPDSFKESLSATEVSFSIKEGVVSILPEAKVEELPFSDGGEGALEVLNKHTEGILVTCPTENALGEAIEASYFLFGKKKKAWIELSQASGLAQIPPNKRNVLKATTYGTGLLIKDALTKGCTEIILGVGGSATNDGGAGIYEALGGYFLDEKDRPIERGGAALCSLKSLIPPQISEKINWKVACDVNNPLLGNTGAATVYAPQKGATKEDVKLLEESMSQLAKVLEQHFNRSVTTLKGGGAAGGTAAGMFGFFNANLVSGFSLLSEQISLENKIKSADLVITAEGKIDAQSTQGKLTGSVAQLCKKYEIPLIGLGGTVEQPYEILYASGFTGVFAIQNGPRSVENSMENAASLLTDATSRVLQFYTQSKK